MPPVLGGINVASLPPHWQDVSMISVSLPLPQAPQQQRRRRPTTPTSLGFGSLMLRAVEAGTITNQQQHSSHHAQDQWRQQLNDNVVTSTFPPIPPLSSYVTSVAKLGTGLIKIPSAPQPLPLL
jgi:hypothetical protein